MYCRGIRGATTIEYDDREEILSATMELLQLMIHQNDLRTEDIASAIFSLTEDLDAEFPAAAARMLGWTEVPLMCTREIPIPGSLATSYSTSTPRGACLRSSTFISAARSICIHHSLVKQRFSGAKYYTYV